MSDIGAVTYEGAAAVTPSDTTADPGGPFAGLQATTAAGLAKVQTLGSNDAVTVYLVLGVILPLAVTRVWSTGTAATGIVGFKSPKIRPTMNPGAGVVLP
jgi:hypothetical protein